MNRNKQQNVIQPWLTVNEAEKAITFYKSAFNAVETYRLNEEGAGIVVKLNVNGAEFWISDGSDEAVQLLGGNNVRMILIVSNPDEVFDSAVKAGAKKVFDVGEDHGWRLGRIEDPFGLHWEIGHQL